MVDWNLEKKILRLEIEKKEIEIKLQRAEIRSFTLADTESSTIYTGTCKSFFDNEKTKLKAEAEFIEGKITGVVKHYSKEGTATESNTLLK